MSRCLNLNLPDIIPLVIITPFASSDMQVFRVTTDLQLPDPKHDIR